jgi:hypothetical protein
MSGTKEAVESAPKKHTGMEWNQTRAESAHKSGIFIKVSSTAQSTGKRLLSRAPVAWEKEPDTIYVLDKRVCGKAEDIRTVLLAAGVQPAEVERGIADAISRFNWNTSQKMNFDKEVDYSTRVNDKPSMFDEVAILRIAKMIAQGKYTVHNVEKTKETAMSDERRTLKSQVEATLEKSKTGKRQVVDVSVRNDMGLGVVREQDKLKTTHLGIEGYGMVSRNYETYLAAFQEVYGTEGLLKVQTQMDELKAKLVEMTKSQQKKPAKPKAAAPKRAPKAKEATAVSGVAAPAVSGAPVKRLSPLPSSVEIPSLTPLPTVSSNSFVSARTSPRAAIQPLQTFGALPTIKM